MFPSLESKLKRFEELELQLQDPAVLSQTERFLEVSREYGGLKKVAASVRSYHRLQADIAAAQAMLDEESDAESKQYAQAELDELQEQLAALETELEDLATAGDSISRGALIMEIRAGTGGDEAALFAGDLFQMYSTFVQDARLEDGGPRHQSLRHGRVQGHHLFRDRRGGLPSAAV